MVIILNSQCGVSSWVSACCRKRLKTESMCKISFESIRPLRLCARVMKCVLRGCVIHPRLKTFPQTLPTVPFFCLLRRCYRDSWAYPFLFLIFSFFTFYYLIPPSRFSWLVSFRAHPDCFFSPDCLPIGLLLCSSVFTFLVFLFSACSLVPYGAAYYADIGLCQLLGAR